MDIKKDTFTILITDDSIVSRKKMKNMLKGGSYNILLAKNGREALDTMAEENIDLVLLDLLMPEVDGIDVLKTMQEESIDIPAIVVSADIQESTREICFKYGAKAFLNKPPEESELKQEIIKALSEKIGE